MTSTYDEAALALLLWHLDATDAEFAQINCERIDALKLLRSIEFELGEQRCEHLTEVGRGLLIAYRAGKMAD
jgi:hypothetical protein